MKSRRLTAAFAILALLGALVSAPAAAEEPQLLPLDPRTDVAAAESPLMADATVQFWLVELAGAPASEGTPLSALRTEKEYFRAAARKAGLQLTEHRSFDTLFNGISLSLPASQVAKLSRMQGVKAVWPNAVMQLDPVFESAGPDLATALAMTGADVANSTLGYTGIGIKVAIMDTGVDYHHPDLGGAFGPGNKVSAGWDFVGDAFNADPASPAFHPIPVPDGDPDDCAGHGTHVAGIVGANGAVKGVAPDVTLGSYRVFGCEGSTTADIMIAAMERALADGMQVLNMSIGSAFQWPQYPTARAADRLVNKGVVVVASIGNYGANGIFSAGAPGLGSKVIGVASFDNTWISLKTFTISPDDTAIGYAQAAASPSAPTSGSAELARTGAPTSSADACDPLPTGSLAGKVALIRRGSCTFYQKALNAQAAGADGAVLYNNAPGRFSATVAGASPITIPVVSVSDIEGKLINDRLAAGSVTMTWTPAQGNFKNPTGNLISSFSSFGLSPDLELKPDIGAPGGLIRSTYPLELGAYSTISGTSMSSPHVAGAVALLLQARPGTPAGAVRSILQNTAEPKNWWGNPALGFLDNVHRQGAGMLQIDDAILSTVKVEPSKLSLGESEAGPATRTITVANHGAGAVTFDLSHKAALSTGPNTYTPGFFTGFASVNFSTPSVTVPAGGTASFDVTITANPTLADRSLYGGYIVLTPQGGGQTYRVPYAGLKGDYQSIQALGPTAYTFPWLARLSGGSYAKQGADATYTMAGSDIPLVLFHLDHQVAKLRLGVKDAVTGRSWHRAFEMDYVGRNANQSGTSFFYTIAWDGTTAAGKKQFTVPNGSYVLELSVLKALGDENNPAHWETWSSPVFTIARP